MRGSGCECKCGCVCNCGVVCDSAPPCVHLRVIVWVPVCDCMCDFVVCMFAWLCVFERDYQCVCVGVCECGCLFRGVNMRVCSCLR